MVAEMFWPKRVCGEVPFEIFHSVYRTSSEQYLEFLKLLEKSRSRHDFLLWAFDVITAGRKRNISQMYNDVLDEASKYYFTDIEETVNACRSDCAGSLATYMVKEYPFLFKKEVIKSMEIKQRCLLSTLSFNDENLWLYRKTTLEKYVQKLYQSVNSVPEFCVNPMKNLTFEDFIVKQRGEDAFELEEESEPEVERSLGAKEKVPESCTEGENYYEAEDEGSGSVSETEKFSEAEAESSETGTEDEDDSKSESDEDLELEIDLEHKAKVNHEDDCEPGFLNEANKDDYLELERQFEDDDASEFTYEDYDLYPALEYFCELLTYIGMVPGRNEGVIVNRNGYKQKQAEAMMKKIRTKQLVPIDYDKALKLAHEETIVVAKITKPDESFAYERAQILLHDGLPINDIVRLFCVDTGKCPILPISDIFVYDLKDFKLSSFREEIIVPTLEKKKEKTVTLAERVPRDKLPEDLQFNDFFSYDCGLSSGGIAKYIPCGRPNKPENFF
uniref:Uncharacterized protein n=1 Tax=Panagrolaimus superbus TaxID=310955 RepID=A0A914ZDZ0_9BILA